MALPVGFYGSLQWIGWLSLLDEVALNHWNTHMEGFWGILKCEMYYGKHYRTKEELIYALEEWFHYFLHFPAPKVARTQILY